MTTPLQIVVQHWQNFYTLLGEASATLIGLLFVAVSLGARMITTETTHRVHAFMTPAVIRFTILLLIAAIVDMPAESAGWLSAEMATIGVVGLVNLALVVSALAVMHRSERFEPTIWLWSAALPALSYAGCIVTACLIHHSANIAMHILASSSIVLLIANIRNAWIIAIFVAAKKTD
jgi:hypothetical protein